ncbi:MAG: amidohydrolase [Acidobacteriota bacterium]|nr:amidohydrolase [Acidobacteriota bacterium]
MLHLCLQMLVWLGFASADPSADIILKNGKLLTMDEDRPRASAIAVTNGVISAVGSDADVTAYKGAGTKVIDLGGRTVIPGLNDSHTHLVRAGLNYNLELRWDGVRSLKEGLQLLREQAKRTPKGRWVRVVGGWTPMQFEEKRMPTLEELNEAAPDTPVFVLYLYSLGYLNQAGIEALGYDKNTYYPGGQVELDASDKPTGLLLAKPSALILYTTLVNLPKLTADEMVNSTLHYYRELNRLGVTSAIDAGGGGQFFPESYKVAQELAKRGELNVRTANYLFAQKKGAEAERFKAWTGSAEQGYNHHSHHSGGFLTYGAGENLTWAAADFENFMEPRPELGGEMEGELEPIVRMLVERRWPFRIHATYNESIERFLDLFEKVNRDTPFNGLRWAIDHAETISTKNLKRIKKLGGGIAIQNRMMFQAEHFTHRYGEKTAHNTPPVRKMLELGIPVGLGTDGTRVSSYNPWYALYWLSTGKDWSGEQIHGPNWALSREEALRLMTRGSAWFSDEENRKGMLREGFLADLAVLSGDYTTIPEEDILTLQANLTMVAGRVVYAAGYFKAHDPGIAPPVPAWSPVHTYKPVR